MDAYIQTLLHKRHALLESVVRVFTVAIFSEQPAISDNLRGVYSCYPHVTCTMTSNTHQPNILFLHRSLSFDQCSKFLHYKSPFGVNRVHGDATIEYWRKNNLPLLCQANLSQIYPTTSSNRHRCAVVCGEMISNRPNTFRMFCR